MINCSADQIYEFATEATRLKDFCFFNMSGFDEAYSLIYEKCNTLRLAGERAFSAIQTSISKAHYAVHVNENEIKSLKSAMYDVEQQINNTDDEEAKEALKKRKERIGNSIYNIRRMNDKLNELSSNLNRKAETISSNVNALRNVEGSINSIKSNIEKSKSSFSNNMETSYKGANNAQVYVRKIDECLSYVANTSSNSSKIICVKAPSYLYNMANSLNSTYKAIMDGDNSYAKALYGYTNVIQDEVSRGIAEKGQEMLERFDYELKDFPNYAIKFNEAGNALTNYERLKLR